MFRRTFGVFAAPPLKLAEDQIQQVLSKQLTEWKVEKSTTGADEASLVKEYTFDDFHAAWSFMGNCVPFINSQDHHPLWSNVYNRVKVTLTTHDCGNQISVRDVTLATHMDQQAAKLAKK